MYVKSCIFFNGVHVDGPPDCPHVQTEDELGPIKDPGWTVQHDAQRARLNDLLAQERNRNAR